jgi:hypothetical protein
MTFNQLCAASDYAASGPSNTPIELVEDHRKSKSFIRIFVALTRRIQKFSLAGKTFSARSFASDLYILYRNSR